MTNVLIAVIYRMPNPSQFSMNLLLIRIVEIELIHP